MRYSLRICAGKQAGQEIPIRGAQFLIGCADNCHLKIRATQVSRYHCAILVQDNCLWVRDFGGGVIVDGTQIDDRRRIDRGDQLQIGPLHFEVLVQEAPVKEKGLAPDDGEILEILSEPVENPVAPMPELGDDGNARAEFPTTPPGIEAAPAAPGEPAETADHLAGDILHDLYHPPKVKLVKFKAALRTPAIKAPSLCPPEVEAAGPTAEIPFEAPQGVSVSAPERHVIAWPRWVFTSDGQINPNVMFVLGIWVGIGLCSAAVTFLGILGR